MLVKNLLPTVHAKTLDYTLHNIKNYLYKIYLKVMLLFKRDISSVQSVQSLSRVRLFVTP